MEWATLINKEEILVTAKARKLYPHTVEKDYVLGWILSGLATVSNIANHWVFKGGTCLKKCYFDQYRFSEDLDFTVMDRSHIDENFLDDLFVLLAEWLYDEVEIEILKHSIRLEIYSNRAGGTSVKAQLNYRGPLRQKTNYPKVKIDLTADELLVTEPERRKIIHNFSDNLVTGSSILCYSFDELFAEKVRALIERVRPRDLYDVIELFKRNNCPLDKQNTQQILAKKCEFKGLSYPTIESVHAHPLRSTLDKAWGKMLQHQLSELSPVEGYWSALPEVFDWLSIEDDAVVGFSCP